MIPLTLATAPLAIKIHVAAALGAILLAAAQFIGKKGVTAHRILGWTWAALMAITALSSFFIVDFRALTPSAAILGLSLLVLVQVPLAVGAARRHAIVEHKTRMTWLTVGALIVAGLFTLLPGRLMHQTLFG
jgi:uncharacterized membrane protein